MEGREGEGSRGVREDAIVRCINVKFKQIQTNGEKDEERGREEENNDAMTMMKTIDVEIGREEEEEGE